MNVTDPAEVLFNLFAVTFWLVAAALTVAGLAVALAAIWNAARLPDHAFGPPWEHTRTAWLLGIGVSFLVPCGSLVTGIHWFRTGRRNLASTGLVNRPFWSGSPRGTHPARP